MLRKLRYSLVTLLVVFLFAGSVSAATTKTFSMTYSVDNEVARNIFPMLNEWRQSGETWYYNSSGTKVSCGKLDALSYDYNLEQVALQRAYEIAVSFAHARPDNTDCWTCYYNGTRSYGEILVAGRTTADKAFEAWQEEDKDYSGQGHRRIMLGAEGYNYKAVGFAHVVLDGKDFWVGEFGYTNSGAAKTTALKGTKTGSVTIDTSTATFSISPSSSFSQVKLGDTQTLPEIVGGYKTAKTWGTKGLKVPSKDITGVTWTSSNTSVLKVVNNTSVKAVGAGSCTLTATATYDGKSYTFSLSVSVPKIYLSNEAITCTVPTCTYDINGVTPKPTIKYGSTTLKEGTDYTITSYMNNTLITENGYVQVTGMGSYSGTKYIQFSIVKADIAGCTVAAISDAVYTGSQIKPDVTVKQNGTALTKGTHYTVTYSNNTTAGTASVTIAGTGKFEGSVTKTFKITPKSVSDVTVSSINDQTYTGSEIKPSVTVKDGTKTMTSGTDYTVSYSNNTEIGKAVITITGKGNYKGTKTVNFSIVEPVYTWKSSGGKWYLYDNTGRMYTGFVTIKGSTYYLNDSGVMQTGWQDIGGKWYWFNTDGVMAKVWKQIGGKWYYFNDEGVMITGWKLSGGIWYYFNKDGDMATGWKQVGGKGYYFKDSGEMVTGWKSVNGKWYWFNSDGQMQTGWKKIDGDWYYFDADGAMKTRWLGLNGKWYYLGTNGIMAQSTSLVIGGKTYNFDSEGVCTNP